MPTVAATLAPGTRIGPYEITTLIGKGGMGEVYAAADTQLRRKVAIKVLPAAVAKDAGRLARLRREAQLLAALDQPGIARVHGLETSNGLTAIVLELVEGEALDDRLARGPLRLADALEIARQIAEALGAAHEQGIVHRDLKPGNVVVRADGRVKLLDFGLAKAMADPDDDADSQLSTVESPLTGAGVVLGTAPYMSPEQARGRAVDRRTDIWAFGCVVYEMLAGRRAFPGETASDTISSILGREPDWTALPAEAAAFAPIVRRCLEKDPARRLRDIGDVRLWLDEAAHAPAASPTAHQRSPPRRRLEWLVAAAIGLAAGGLLAWLLTRSPTQAPLRRVARFELASTQSGTLSTALFGHNVAISPDGSRVAYTSVLQGRPTLFLRRLDQPAAVPLAGTEGATQPFFSPDGQKLGFATNLSIAYVSVDGGVPTVVCTLNPGTRTGSWGSDDAIVFAQGAGSGIFRVKAAAGQTPEPILRGSAETGESYAEPSPLPEGHGLLYTVLLPGGGSRVEARRLDGSATTVVAEGGVGARYMPPGFVLFAKGNRVMAVRFDASSLRTSGAPVVAFEGAFTKAADGVADIAVAGDGTAIFLAGQNGDSERRLVWVDRIGRRLGPAIDEFLVLARNQRLSPDGRRLAITVGNSASAQIWIYDLTGADQPIKLTHRDHNTFANWSADGRRIYFLHAARPTAEATVRSLPADGSVLEPEPVSPDEPSGAPLACSPDGAYLIYGHRSKNTLLPLRGGAPQPWPGTPFREVGADFSRDGRLVAYASDPSGRLEIYVRPFPGPGTPVRVSAEGGHDPRWSHDGRELYFRNGARVFSAKVLSATPAFRAERPRLLFEGDYSHEQHNSTIRFYDVAPNGRFLMLAPAGKSTASLVLVQNWAEELERLMSR
jgi:serine/threonine-protein kinase